ncbi:hypothetical protein, partial [Pseudomonas sp. 2822-17]|uniref:hypothetical protein n=1 Tax=Pseudomonas sp. 2822-17 TaxID=1712678 RepID=UPI001179C641
MFLRFLLERKKYLFTGTEQTIRVSPSLSVADAMKKVNRQKYHYFVFGNNSEKLEEKRVLEAFFDEDKR